MTSFILPTSVSSPISRWSVVDWISPVFTSKAAGSGLATIDCGVLEVDSQWLIDHATVQCTSTTPTQVRWYDSEAAPRNLIDGSNSGNFDVGDWPGGLLVRPHSSLVVQWSGCSDGAVAIVRLQARLMRQVTG